jgi:hypothetical protein
MQITSHEIESLLNTITPLRLEDIVTLVELGKKITGKEPKLWGSIIGFGNVHYVYQTGNQGDMPIFGIASRKHAITLYLSYTLETYEELKELGKHSIGKGCLYIKRLADIRMDVLEKLIRKAIIDTMNISFITENKE